MVAERPVVYDMPGVSETVVADGPVSLQTVEQIVEVVTESVVAARPVVYDRPVDTCLAVDPKSKVDCETGHPDDVENCAAFIAANICKKC